MRVPQPVLAVARAEPTGWSVPNDRRTDAPQRRTEVLDAATRVFHAKGYEAASIQDVAEELGMLKGSLYYYIDSKEDLLFAIIEEVHRTTMERLELWLTLDDLPTLEQLRAFLTWQIVSYCRDVAKVGVFLNDFRSLSEEHQEAITAERDRYDRVLRDLIRVGQREGVIDTGVDPKLTAMAVFGMMNWIATWWDPDGPNTPEQVAEQYTDLVLGGLLTRPDGTPRGDIAPLPDRLLDELRAAPQLDQDTADGGAATG